MTAGVTAGPQEGATASPPGAVGRRRGAGARVAGLLVLPYLLLGLVWSVTNPPGASPDEADHLVKALAAARLDIGTAYEGEPRDTAAGRRNASISRVVEVPARLAPDGFTCMAFSTVPPTCLPADDGVEPGLATRVTTVGAYPPFGYAPMGLVASLADTPNRAFLLARLTGLAISTGLLFLGVWHLVRWLGRGAAVGLAVALTPMAVFSAASVSTSGLEIMSAAAVGAVAVVATRHPRSLADGPTLAVLAVSASALVLSRQLGAVTLGMMALVVLLRGGAPVVWEQLRRLRPAFLAAAGTVLAATAVVVTWELRYDHPAETGTALSADAAGTFWEQAYGYVHSGVGKFGWLDTPLPGTAVAVWVVVAVLLCAGAVLLGRRGDRWTVTATVALTAAVAYVTHATVFHPIDASLQGRHVIALFLLAPLLSGVVLVERLVELGDPVRDAVRRLFVLVGVSMAGLQLFALLVNARRYAVGLDGPILFLGDAVWEPRLGWLPWLLLAAVAAVGLAVTTVRSASSPLRAPAPPGEAHVER
ncbi:DUF2142 domain-containing protein [Thalassiella azotivora]